MTELGLLYKTTEGRTLDVVRWPGTYQCAVTFTFDYDAMVGRKGAGQGPVEVSQGEFGPRVGIWRIMDLLDKYDIKGTFFTPGMVAHLYPDSIRELARRGHEIASHTWDHKDVTHLTLEDEREKLRKTTDILAELSGKKPNGWRKIQTSPNTLRLLKDDGYDYIASGMADDVPYWWTGSGLLAIPYQWIYDDAMFFAYVPGRGSGLQNPAKVFEIWSAEFTWMYNTGRYYHQICHPFVSGRGLILKLLERLIIHMKQVPNVWFATCREITEYWKEAYPEK